jgi:hypothetical protein
MEGEDGPRRRRRTVNKKYTNGQYELPLVGLATAAVLVNPLSRR